MALNRSSSLEKSENHGQSASSDAAEVIRRSTEADAADDGPPDGGLVAWMTIVGGWLVYFCGLGFFNSYGVFQDFYVRKFMTNKTPSEIAWIGSFEIALQFFLGIPVGIAFDAGYFHHLMIGGSFIYCFSLFMVSLAQPGQYYQVFLAQGVGMGIGLAMTFLPVVTVVAHHFSRRRGFAIGILMTGGSIGGIIFPIMLNKLIFGPQGFALGVRATAAVITGLLAIANLLIRTRPPVLREGDPRLKRTSLRVLLKDMPYMTCVASGVLLTLGIFYPIFYLQLFSVKHGIDQSLAFYIVSFLNAGGFFGRLIPNFLADKVGSYNVLIPTSFACAALVLAILGVHNAAGAIMVALLYGAMNGAHISVTPALLSDISSHVSEVGIRMGFYFTMQAAAALFGQPISGALLTERFVWWRPTVFSGVCLTAGAVAYAATTGLVYDLDVILFSAFSKNQFRKFSTTLRSLRDLLLGSLPLAVGALTTRFSLKWECSYPPTHNQRSPPSTNRYHFLLRSILALGLGLELCSTRGTTLTRWQKFRRSKPVLCEYTHAHQTLGLGQTGRAGEITGGRYGRQLSDCPRITRTSERKVGNAFFCCFSHSTLTM
ncbi:putative MFS general substrate transporter [Lyophyllum shimeji]|uniref:MFS general substrate transporter n=1 Tax=Lyophyllum shimeji TaxID=47721 RepID=A0A9P3URU1_LYOSH|nr:putative MFS general substrate transporter [Lyophyllum shimeji]